MRSTNFRGRFLVAACSAIAAAASIAGCGSDQAVTCWPSDSGGSDDSSDDSSGNPGDDSATVLLINGTFTNTDCPSVNPLSIGPDNAGLVSVTATFNGSVDDSGAFTLTWTATSGAFVDPHALDTTFQCLAAGNATVTFTVSGAGCSQEYSGIVRCTTVLGSHV
jgi:hypothetical protein